MGLPGPGIEQYLDTLQKSRLLHQDKPIGLSIGGDSLDEYKMVFDTIHACISKQNTCPIYYEINAAENL